MSELHDYYKQQVIPQLLNTLGKKSVYQVPSVKKVTLNIGLGASVKDARYLEASEQTLRRICGQQPVKTKARKAISSFKIREGMVVGMKVTLRGKRMWDFLDKLIHITLPRVRDFRGISLHAFDEKGNYSIGFKEHLAFPEIRSDEIEIIHGLQVVLTLNTQKKEEGQKLLESLGFPFQK